MIFIFFQAPNKIPADIVFIIRDKPHQHFKREGSDLRHICKITLREVGFIMFKHLPLEKSLMLTKDHYSFEVYEYTYIT